MIKTTLALIAGLSFAMPAQAFITIGVCPDGGGICVAPAVPPAPSSTPAKDDTDPMPWEEKADDKAGFRERVAGVVLRECERRTARTWADLWAAVDTKMEHAPKGQQRLWEKMPYEEQLKMIKKLGGVLCS